MVSWSVSRRLARSVFHALPQKASPTLCLSSQQLSRAFSQTFRRPADEDVSAINLLSNSLRQNTQRPPPQSANTMQTLADSVLGRPANSQARASAAASGPIESLVGLAEDDKTGGEPYHFHIYSHKHNTHVTVTKPDRTAILSLSCGNLGFRKSARKHYDSAYQLGAYVVDRLQQGGWHKKMHEIEVNLRGFGAGREAVVKVLMGNEGRALRSKIVRVADSTRLKFGGTRSPKPRRLG